MFTLGENMLFFAKWKRSFGLETVLIGQSFLGFLLRPLLTQFLEFGAQAMTQGGFRAEALRAKFPLLRRFRRCVVHRETDFATHVRSPVQ